MAINQSIKLLAEPMKTLASGSISGTYAGIGTAFDKPIRILILQNFTDEGVIFSFDGIDDHIPLPTSAYMIIDITGNKTGAGGGFFIAEGTRIYVKQLAGVPGSGSVYISALYGAP